MSWKASILTLFPDAFPGVLGTSIIGSALKDEIWSLEAIDIRDFSYNKHRSVDTSPAGGGPGMVLSPEVAARAIDSLQNCQAENSVKNKSEARKPNGDTRPLIYLTPKGTPLTQAKVRELASGNGVALFCGRFEGLDQRVIEARNMQEISVGDYVLAGGEVAAQVLIEACVRLLPNVLGDANSLEDESFENGLLEYPLYAKLREWEGRKTPPVLLSGNHKAIAKWRLEQMEEITKQRRPDLWQKYQAKKEKKNECD